MAGKAKCQVVYGEEVQGVILVAAFAWTGALQKISRSPTGLSHHFQWKAGGQSLHVRNGCFQGATAQERQLADGELTEWLEQAELAGESMLIAGDFNATRSELAVSRWFEAAGWYEWSGPNNQRLACRAKPSRGGWTGCWPVVGCRRRFAEMQRSAGTSA